MIYVVRIPIGLGSKWAQDILNMSSINCMPKNLNCNAIIVTMECTKKTLTKKCKSKQSGASCKVSSHVSILQLNGFYFP